jgi:hypothetical protein
MHVSHGHIGHRVRECVGAYGDLVVSVGDRGVRDGDVGGIVGWIDAVGIRNRIGLDDFDVPHSEPACDRRAIRTRPVNVEMRRVPDGDFVEREVIGAFAGENIGIILNAYGIGGIGLEGVAIPRIALSYSVDDQIVFAAAVDDAITHDSGSRRVFGFDERPTAVADRSDRPAGLLRSGHRAVLVVGGIARSKDGDAAIHQKRDAGWKAHRRDQESVFVSGSGKFYSLAGRAGVERALDAGSVEGGFGGGFTGCDGELGGERDAGGRKRRLGDRAGVLTTKKPPADSQQESHCQQERPRQQERNSAGGFHGLT